jgi:teichuronic acid biosynthesis glycosyltransferase TuaG
MPKVSVIVTTYNRKDFLTPTINSIQNQTYKNFELIVVDNCSDYDIISHIKSFCDERIRPFQNVNDVIIAVNRNFGIKKAKGDYIAFCDDDDIWHCEKLEKQINYILSHHLENEKVVIYTNFNYVYETHKEVIQKKKINSINDLILSNHVCLSSSLVSNNNFHFDENKNYIAVED